MHELGDHAWRRGIGAASMIGSLLVGVLLLAACAGGSTASGRVGGTVTPQGTATAPASGTTWSGQLPTVAGLAWVQQSVATGKPQVWASIGGRPGRMIAEAAGDDCATSLLGPPVLSPDAKHIAVVGGAGCGDGQSHGPIFVVDVAAGTMTPIADTNALTNERTIGWMNNSTLYSTGDSVIVHRLGETSATTLPGTTGAVAATVRGSQLFYVVFAYDSTRVHIQASLHRYNMISQHDVNVIDLGAFNLPAGRSPPDYHSEGWDVSADGTHVVYQVTAAGPVPTTAQIGISSSRIYYASADSGTRSQILQYMATNNLVRLRLSPDGRQVAVTEAIPTPDIISGCVNSPGASPQSDPCFHSYALRQGLFSAGYPAWLPDGAAFFVAARGDGNAADNGLYRFTVGAPTGTLVQPGAYSPWEW